MADVTELACWPSSPDALDWSQDGIIALASDERVELIFPNTVSHTRDSESPQWQHVSLKANLFSADELPIKEPAPLPIYSIGEEISSSAPLAIAWSPPGVARHRRCTLGTLTANLVLSIWSAEGNLHEESSWCRKIIINHALSEYFPNIPTEESGHMNLTAEVQLRLRTRVRTFAWAPIMPDAELIHVVGTALSYGPYFIALSNEDNQVALIEIESPTSSLGEERIWCAKVVTHFSLKTTSESPNPEPTIFEDIMTQQRHVSEIAWSPWAFRDGQHHSVIMYATNDDVRARAVIYIQNCIEFGDEIVYSSMASRSNGPMKWSPIVENGNSLRLAFFAKFELVCLTVSALDASVIEKVSHNLNGQWDSISGVVWDNNTPSTPRIHFSTLLSTLNNPTAALGISSDELTRLPSPNWRDQIENNLVLFSVKNDLKGHGKAKVWGLSTSPLGDFIATSNTVHPSDMIEYGPPADRRGTIAISTLIQYKQIREAFPRRNVTAEGVLFTLKKLVENSVEDADQMPEFAREMVQKLLQAYKSPSQPEMNEYEAVIKPDPENINPLIKTFKKSAFLNTANLSDRYEILVSHASTNASSNDVPKTSIAYRLANAVQNLPPDLSSTPFSKAVLNHHRCLNALVNKVMDPDHEDEIATGKFEAALPDKCDFCSSPIPFVDLNAACCTQGHQFARCGLTFLAIQAPRIIKRCGICSTAFLSEEFVAAQETEAQRESGKAEGRAIINNDLNGVEARPSTNTDQMSSENTTVNNSNEQPQVQTQREKAASQGLQVDTNAVEDPFEAPGAPQKLPVTLARVLFLACDVCIYCGGKFVG